MSKDGIFQIGDQSDSQGIEQVKKNLIPIDFSNSQEIVLNPVETTFTLINQTFEPREIVIDGLSIIVSNTQMFSSHGVEWNLYINGLLHGQYNRIFNPFGDFSKPAPVRIYDSKMRSIRLDLTCHVNVFFLEVYSRIMGLVIK